MSSIKKEKGNQINEALSQKFYPTQNKKKKIKPIQISNMSNFALKRSNLLLFIIIKKFKTIL